MKTLMLIGKTNCGKTTLTQAINEDDLHYKKTQTVEIIDGIIDTPGEYIENRSYYRALIVTSADSDVIAMIQDCTQEDSIFPPSFASIFAKPIIGIITKTDLCCDENKLKAAEEVLVSAGVERIFRISAFDKSGLENLKDYIMN
ncbi:EutP/PduV family microcompartment system protein [Clostridium sp. CM028]|uniref:EutP/PduV family microcompartment system protein n=1 Tax=unclassified Clostridium TaxID=2614128 RepID=UPI001C0C0435|nr:MULTISPECIES: EutP/PduV family microcompartment system protein [unclassified Clostridium]MBU3092656.1 EutP/PduV family microcompartment system protein [Clostridium sp. CF011]MBW9148884.1 EutP/PduV family microcompartment system protein [Clostridium sp. CM028]WAG71461.1 EutP/PduV family microcompartment system protein [Clostridium sp. CF011]WLC63013.1 EutP/PduV family microcompartment system protein [Clostridium sp. CM028]